MGDGHDGGPTVECVEYREVGRGAREDDFGDSERLTALVVVES